MGIRRPLYTPGGANSLSLVTAEFATRTVLYEEILASAGIFDVTSIDQSYDYLLIYLLLRGDVSADSDTGIVYLNNDTTDTNYRQAYNYGGSGISGGVADDSVFSDFPGDTGLANSFSTHIMRIDDYANTSVLTGINVFSGYRLTSTGIYVRQSYIEWESLNAVTRVTIRPDGYPTDEFVAGSSIRVLGSKNLTVVTGATLT